MVGRPPDVSTAPKPDAKLPWLSILAEDGIWHWADAKIDGRDLAVSSVEGKDPPNVRKVFTNHPEGIYDYNKAELLASLFGTDTEIK